MTSIFGTDGIRGRVGEWPMTPEFFLKLGKIIGVVLPAEAREKLVLIGRDTRLSGIMLQQAFTSGILSSGVKVVDLGVIPTAAVARLVRHYEAKIGVVISASHNPADQNGIKFFDEHGEKLSEITELTIEKYILGEVKIGELLYEKQEIGDIINGELLHHDYLMDLLSEHPVRFLEGLTILVDCSNGSAYKIAPQIFGLAGANVITINASPSGNNINVKSGSEYVRRSPSVFHELIRLLGADFGLAFDGDADRVVFVDEEGSLIDGDHILGLLARYLDRKNQLLARTIVTSNMRNNGLKEFLEASGISVLETPVGDKYIIEKIAELKSGNAANEKIGLGGEQAGHVVLIDDKFTTGDGIRTALFLIRAYLESHASSYSEFVSIINKTPQIIASAYVGQGTRLERSKLDELQKQVLNSNQGLSRINLRYSGTEPVFRAMLEGDHRYTEQELAGIAIDICSKVQAASNIVGGEIDILNCSRGGVISNV